MARSYAQARKPKSRGPKRGTDEKAAPPAKKGSNAKRGKDAGKKDSDKKDAPRRSARSRGKGKSARQEKAKPATAEELDAAMDDYWMTSEKKEVVGKKLDEEMDAYWEKKNAAKGADGEAATEGSDAAAAGGEGKAEAS